MTFASQIAGAEPRGFLGGGRRDNERAFRKARRHSRLVRFMRLAIPLGILLGFGGSYVAQKWLAPLHALAQLPITTEGTVISGTKILWQQPLVNGYTKDKQPFSVMARTAAQDINNPDTIELQEIQATMATGDKSKVKLTALEGVYNGKTEKLTLQRQVLITSPEFEATLRETVMHVRKGDVVSEQPLEVRMLQGKLNANRLEINKSGEVILFDGGVTLVINGSALDQDVTGSTR